MKALIMLYGRLRRADIGDVELLPEGVKVKMPAKMRWWFILNPAIAQWFIRSGELVIPYPSIVGLELIHEKAGLLTPRTPFIRLHFRDMQGVGNSITFAAYGWTKTSTKPEETLALYEEIRRRTGR
ncbi:hypothetical protein HRbin01_01728 [archaeon HR01]|nr:hypothetical protein HRbin01_01728 [archaeon HR01]